MRISRSETNIFARHELVHKARNSGTSIRVCRLSLNKKEQSRDLVVAVSGELWKKHWKWRMFTSIYNKKPKTSEVKHPLKRSHVWTAEIGKAYMVDHKWGVQHSLTFSCNANILSHASQNRGQPKCLGKPVFLKKTTVQASQPFFWWFWLWNIHHILWSKACGCFPLKYVLKFRCFIFKPTDIIYWSYLKRFSKVSSFPIHAEREEALWSKFATESGQYTKFAHLLFIRSSCAEVFCRIVFLKGSRSFSGKYPGVVSISLPYYIFNAQDNTFD